MGINYSLGSLGLSEPLETIEVYGVQPSPQGKYMQLQ